MKHRTNTHTARKIAFVLVALAILASGIVLLATGPGFSAGQERALAKGQPTAKWMRTPCEYEDSVNCYWDAGTMGNKKGHSFYVRYLPGKAHMTCVFYTQRYYAKRHDYCTGNDVLDSPKRKGDAHPDFDIDGWIE
jgi:hypothetical protein